MSYIDDLKTQLGYLEQSNANQAAADELRAEIAELESASKKPARPAKKSAK